MKLFYSLIIGIFIFDGDVRANDKGTTPDTILKAVAIHDCSCQQQELDSDPKTIELKKDSSIGETCRVDGSSVICRDGYAQSIICPKKCVSLKNQGRSIDDEIKLAVMEIAPKISKDLYLKKVPNSIISKINARYPKWLPLLYNKSGPFIANFSAMETFYFEVPLLIDGKVLDISIVYFFQDFEHLLKSRMNWSFWVTSTGELLHDSLAPYLLYDGGYVHNPCLVPAGLKLDEIILYGVASGTSDAVGCCGPFSLKQIKNGGPVEIKKDSSEVFDPNVIYNLCSRSSNPSTGKYGPQGLYEIDGPANIRKYHEVGSWTKDNKFIGPLEPAKSEIIGSCPDQSKVVDLGSRGDWHHVYCDGKSGWTHKKNIRGLK